jgi:hypothetical protein
MTGRRLPLVVLLVGLLVAAIAVGDRTVRTDRGVTTPAVAASSPAAGVRSSAWYCAGGPVGKGASADQVTISNVGSHPVSVAIDVMVVGHAVAEHFVTVAARSSTTVPVSRFSRASSAALVVQPLGSDVVVEQGFAVNGDVAMAPCATRASSDWYFAAGSSVSGAQTWLALFNPFADDAVVDVESYSEDGIRDPGTLQGIDVSPGSRLVVRVDQSVAQQRIAAVAVHARSGSRVVATQSVVEPGSHGHINASISLGALTPSTTWMFADNRSVAGATQQLVLANPGEVDATARVQVVTDVAATIAAREVKVPATTAVAVDFSTVVPVGAAYTLVVDSEVPLVAETRDTYGGEFPGLVTEVGATAAAPQWLFAGGPFTATGLENGRIELPAGTDFRVVMNASATDSRIASVRAVLTHNHHVKSVRTATHAAGPVTLDVAATKVAYIASLIEYARKRPGVDTVVTATKGPSYADDIVVLNPGPRAAVVSLVATAGGDTVPGPGMTNVEIAPFHAVTMPLVTLAQKGVAVVLHATGAVVAERFTGGPWGVTRSPGVP